MDVRVKHAGGNTGRVIAARVQPGTDLLDGIAKVCDEHGIKYAAVQCAIGSLRKATYLTLFKMDNKLGAGYGDPIVVEGPVELMTGQGVVCEQADGKRTIHFHAVFSDDKLRIYGGHMVQGQNPVLSTIDAVITEITGARLMRRFEEETGLVQFSPENE